MVNLLSIQLKAFLCCSFEQNTFLCPNLIITLFFHIRFYDEQILER